ncbi:exosortase-associated protein EpsI, B-type [Rhodocyclus tenuis]|uniref:EpsI family protein n=1 Tax=Rhodocyclus tenuis TaxID=1066 RepID=A0A840G5K2_RHOTE|nr:exosortase-associated protein EpsI, B-type [Rhodocyclus tenuis]MBB4247196.1 EpsI family protein [Rhodocyclus tenuis]
MNVWLRNSILLALMLAASGLAFALRPTQKIAEQGPKVDLETMIPQAFGDWREEQQSATQIVDPQQKAMIDKIYKQTLSRTYVNGEGYRIMLSISYGSDQTDSMQVHKPEVCYPAQGFVLQGKQVGSLKTSQGSIPVTRIFATLGQRSEPVTYWTTVGDRVVASGINKKLIEMSYGLTGKIPDGMLIRISSIDPEAAKAYAMQDRFAAQMLAGLAPEYRQRVAGNLQLN